MDECVICERGFECEKEKEKEKEYQTVLLLNFQVFEKNTEGKNRERRK